MGTHENPAVWAEHCGSVFSPMGLSCAVETPAWQPPGWYQQKCCLQVQHGLLQDKVCCQLTCAVGACEIWGVKGCCGGHCRAMLSQRPLVIRVFADVTDKNVCWCYLGKAWPQNLEFNCSVSLNKGRRSVSWLFIMWAVAQYHSHIVTSHV